MARRVASLRAVGWGKRATNFGVQQGGVEAVVVGRALPPARGVQARRVRPVEEVVGERERASRPLGRCFRRRHGPQPGDADQAAVRPMPRLELPDPGVGLFPALLDRAERDSRRLPSVHVETVAGGRAGEEHERLAEEVELELLTDPVPDDVGAARVAGDVEAHRRVDGLAVAEVGGHRALLVGAEALCDPSHRVVEDRLTARKRGAGLPNEACIAHPTEPVVVVAVATVAFGKGGGRSSDGPAMMVRHPAQDRERAGHVRSGEHAIAVRDRRAPRGRRGAPAVVGPGQVIGYRAGKEFRDEVVAFAGNDFQP